MTPLLRLAETDAVAVATRDIAAGETLVLGAISVVVETAVPLGYKVALQSIKSGEKILKYRVPIGTATENIAAGAIVHTHNMRSDYIPTYTLEAGHRFGEEA